MAVRRPPLSELIDVAEQEFDDQLAGADSRLRRSVLGVLARIGAGMAHSFYGLIQDEFKNVFTRTMKRDRLIIEAADYGVDLKAATYATFSVTLTGDPVTVDAGTVFQRADGATFTSQADVTLSAGTGTGTVSADVAGAAGTTATGSTLTFVSPVGGVANTVTVLAGGTPGTDEERTEALRGRLQARKRNPPGPGKRTDYERWAKEVPGVTRAWAYEQWDGPGSVGLTFVYDDRDDIVPTDDDLDAMYDYIEARRGVCRRTVVFAPTIVPRDYTIHLAPDSAAIRAAVTASLADLIRREGEPAGTLLISHEREAVSTSDGEFDHVMSAPTANHTYAAGELPVLGDITWV